MTDWAESGFMKREHRTEAAREHGGEVDKRVKVGNGKKAKHDEKEDRKYSYSVLLMSRGFILCNGPRFSVFRAFLFLHFFFNSWWEGKPSR